MHLETEVSDTPSAQPGEPDRTPHAVPVIRRWWVRFKGPIVAVAGVGAVLSGLAGWYTTYRAVKTAAAESSSIGTSPGLATGLTSADAVYPLSIMVLPLANQTGDVAKGYVADGLTTSITSDLSRIRDAMVLAPAQAYAFRDKTMSLQQLGREAGVRFILQGSLQASGEKVRVAMQLADATTGALLWSDTMEGQLADLFALQDAVTQRVSASIDPAMTVYAARSTESRQGSPKAQDLILRAKAQALQPVSLDYYRNIQALYRQALEVEPDSVAASFGLASSLLGEINIFSSTLPEERRRIAKAEAEQLAARLQQREPNSPRTLQILWAIARVPRDCPKLAELGPARLALEPNNRTVNSSVGLAISLAGQPQVGIPYIQHAVELNPRIPNIYKTQLGIAYVLQGEHAKAIPWLLEGIQAQPNYPDTYAWLAVAYELQGDTQQARAMLSRLSALAPRFSVKDFDAPHVTCSPQEVAFWNAHAGALAQRIGIPP